MRIGKFVAITKGISGKANKNGFYVKRGEKTVQTKNYQPEEKNNTKSPRYWLKYWLTWFGIFIFDILLVLCPLFAINAYNLLAMMIVYSIIASLLAAAFTTQLLLLDDNTKEYHACEHQVAVLLNENLLPTLENLQKMPRTVWNCGTTLGAIMSVVPLTMGIAEIIIFGVVSITLQAHYFIHYFILLLLVSVLVPILLLICLTLGLLVQSFICTCKPSGEKLKEAFEVAEEFYRQN